MGKNYEGIGRGRYLTWSVSLVIALCIFIGADRGVSVATTEELSQSNPLYCANGSTFITSQTYPTVMGDEPGMNLGWFVKFNPRPEFYTNEAESVPIIRIKPKFDNSGNRTGDYFFAKGDDDDGSDNGIPNEYEPMPQLNDNEMGFIIDSNPGRLWVIGNEMDRVFSQDSLFPTTYAKAYHEAYNFIKRRDPTAQVAIGALVQVTPGRIQYLDMVWEAYEQLYGKEMPVDVWTFHVYPIPEVRNFDRSQDAGASVALGTDRDLAKSDASVRMGNATVNDASLCQDEDVYCFAEHDDVDIFKEQVVAMRTWMAENGQKEKPLILTEWSILWPADLFDEFGVQFGEARVASYLDETVEYLETASDPNIGYSLDQNRLVQRWSWYPVHVDSLELAGSSRLVESDGSLTQIGEAYKDQIDTQPGPFIDLIVDEVFNGGTSVPEGETTTTAVVGVQVRNAGNIATTSPTTVEVVDSSTGQVVASGIIPAGLQGCATDVSHVYMEWPNLSPGLKTFDINIPNSFDPTPSNNVGSGEVFIGTKDVFMPLTSTE